MEIFFKTGDILEEKTDGLICSGNVQLNMSGGINGALLLRDGGAMQEALHGHLEQNNIRYVKPGFVMLIGPQPFHFKGIVYTVAIDAFYESSIELVEKSLTNALGLLQEEGCDTVAIPALATGYGHLGKNDFGKALKQCLSGREWSFSRANVVMQTDIDLDEVKSGFES